MGISSRMGVRRKRSALGSESPCSALDKNHLGGWEQRPPYIHCKAVQPLESVNYPSFRRCIASQYHITISDIECMTARLVIACRKLLYPTFGSTGFALGWCDSLRYSSTSICSPSQRLLYSVLICSTPVLALIKRDLFLEDLKIT